VSSPDARDTGSPPKLLDRVRRTIHMRHYSRRTESTYAHWIRRFIVFHHKQHPNTMGAPEITAFLSWLATSRHVSASTQNQALSALLFLYKHVLHISLGPIEPAARGKLPHRVPEVLTPAEVSSILAQLTGVMWLVVAFLFGAGLRLQECLELRVKDLDFDRHEILVRRGRVRRIGGACSRRASTSDSGHTCRQ
jgi:site-specific recombinase XerD